MFGIARSSSALGVGELEITPVSAAIARHLGIDLTPEGTAARNRRGIALIVHGAPMSGKGSCVHILLIFKKSNKNNKTKYADSLR